MTDIQKKMLLLVEHCLNTYNKCKYEELEGNALSSIEEIITKMNELFGCNGWITSDLTICPNCSGGFIFEDDSHQICPECKGEEKIICRKIKEDNYVKGN